MVNLCTKVISLNDKGTWVFGGRYLLGGHSVCRFVHHMWLDFLFWGYLALHGQLNAPYYYLIASFLVFYTSYTYLEFWSRVNFQHPYFLTKKKSKVKNRKHKDEQPRYTTWTQYTIFVVYFEKYLLCHVPLTLLRVLYIESLLHREGKHCLIPNPQQGTMQYYHEKPKKQLKS